MQKLSNIVVKVLFKSLSCVFNTGVEVHRSLAENFESFLKSYDILLSYRVNVFTFF